MSGEERMEKSERLAVLLLRRWGCAAGRLASGLISLRDLLTIVSDFRFRTEALVVGVLDLLYDVNITA